MHRIVINGSSDNTLHNIQTKLCYKEAVSLQGADQYTLNANIKN